jgi:hydrogenase expression/formation protein HypE
VLAPQALTAAKEMLTQISVVPEGVAAGTIGTHGMHDVTEGGVLGAAWEMCRVAGAGARIWTDKIPVDPITHKICNHFGLDPLRLISSGSMLITVAPDKKEAMEEAMSEIGVQATYIGQVVEEGITMERNGKWHEVVPPAGDELYKVVGQE